MPVASQLGFKAESTYATAVTVDAFAEFVSENIHATPGRVMAVTKRSGQRNRRGDRVVPYLNGASGTIDMPVLSKGHGKLLLWAMGGNATTGPVDSAYTHTSTIADLTGDFFTLQADRPFNPSGTSQAFTWAGCKITDAEWKLTTGVDGYLRATYNVDAATQVTATALATASYPTAAELFPWINATCTIGGSAVELVEGSIKLTNALKTDRNYIRGSSTKKEPLENGQRVVTFSLTLDFVDLTHYNRVVSVTAAGMQAQTILAITAPTLLGASAYPSITFTMPQCEFDDATGVDVSGDDPIRVTLTGEATYNGSASALTIAYVSGDVTI